MPEEMMTTTASAEEMDLTQYLPSLDGLQSSLATWLKVLVMIGPIIMLLLGLYYFFLSPKEANHSAGYRFRYAMSRVGVWRFTQKIAGIAYGSLGLILSIVMLCLISGFDEMNPPDLVWYTVKCLLWQIIPALVAMLAVDAIVVIRYNYNGRLRNRKKNGKAEQTAETKPAATPTKRPETKPATAPAKRPGTKPASAPAKRPGTKPTSGAARRPGTKPTAPAARRPGTKPTATAARRPGTKPTSGATKRPGTAPAKRPAPQSSAFQRPDDL